MSSTKNTSYVVIGGKHVYAAIQPSPIEEEIIKIGQHIATFQRRAIESTCCRKGFKVTFHCNLLHTVVAAIKDAVYAAHSDKSALLCSDDKEYCPAGKNMWLPKQQEMQIMTLILSNSKETHSTGLTYKTTNGVITKQTIPLGSCCLHFQGAGSQAPGIQHQSIVLPNCPPDGSVWRCICTMRFTLDPVDNGTKVNERILEDLYSKVQPAHIINDYNLVGVLDQSQSYEVTNSNHDTEVDFKIAAKDIQTVTNTTGIPTRGSKRNHSTLKGVNLLLT